MPAYRRTGGSVTRAHLKVRVGGATMGAGRRLRNPLVDPPPVGDGSTTYTAEPLGAGGWVTGMSISPDGLTRLARTDTMGAWRWDTTADKWLATTNGTSMPTGYKEPDSGQGVQSIVAANDVAFMAYRDSVFKSADKGLTWTMAAAGLAVTKPNTGNQRWWNNRLAVDPANTTHVLYGTYQGGLFYSNDRGATWTQAPAVPVGTSTWGIPCVAVDTSGNWYAAPHGSGVYRSTDHGSTWTKISSDSQFIIVAGMAAGANGDVVVTGHTSTAMDSASAVVYRYRSGAWTNISPTGANNVRSWRSVAYDPINAGAMLLQADGGYERRSTDYGTTWVESWNNFHSDAPDVPWLAAANGYAAHYYYVTVGGLAFDPSVSDRVWMSQGIGVWYADLSPTLTSDVMWTAQSRGIEQLVVNDVLCPPGQPPIVASWDRPLFLVGETTSVPYVSIAAPATIPVGYGGSLAATVVRGYPNPITHAWTVVTKPVASTGGTFGSPSAASTSFTPDATGSYTLRVTSTNAIGSHTTDVTLTATTAVTSLSLPGTAGNFLQTPDDASLNVPYSLTLVVQAGLASWQPASPVGLLGKFSGSSKGYLLSVSSTGMKIQLSTSSNGATGYNNDILTPLTFPDYSVQWIKMVYDNTARTMVISTSTDGTTWTVYQSSTTGGIPVGTSLYGSSAPLQVGYNPTLGTQTMTGKVYRAKVYDGATLVADFDSSAVTRTGVRTPGTYTGTTGKVWTPQGTGWDWA